ncbi:MAG TPA: glycosyltransferase family 39 protein [Gemmatimonadota bacterium]|nr:glycosyltransferase family 39 protein [Gemmatimonadota bacterium]
MPADPPKLNHGPRSRKLTALAVLSVMGIALGYQLTLRDGHDWGGDFAQYLQQARNLAEGAPFAQTSHVIVPGVPGVGPPSYPPVFSLMLAPTFVLRGGLDWPLVKLVVVISFALFLLAVFATLRERLGDDRALVVILLMGLSPFFWQQKDQVLSDIPFAFLVFLSLYLAQGAYDETRTWRQRLVFTLATGLTVYLATGTRAIGVSLVLTLFVFEVIRTRRVPRQALLMTALVVVLQQVQRLALGPTGGYLGFWRLEPLAVLHRVAAYPVELKYLFWNGYVNGIAVALALIFTGLAIYGYVASLRRGITLAEVFVVCYLAPLVLWPMRPNIRFMIPLIPLYLCYALQGLQLLGLRLSGRSHAGASLALVVLVAGSYASGYARADHGRLREGVLAPESVALFEFVRSQAQPGDHFIFFKPRVLSFFTGVRSSVEYYPAEPAELWDYYSRAAATHVIGRVGDEKFEAFVAGNGGSLVRIFQNDDFVVCRILRPVDNSRNEISDHTKPGETGPQA